MSDIIDVEKFGNVSIGDIVIYNNMRCVLANERQYGYQLFFLGHHPDVSIDKNDIKKLQVDEHISIMDKMKMSETRLFSENSNFDTPLKIINYLYDGRDFRLFYYPFSGKLYSSFPGNTITIVQAIIRQYDIDELFKYGDILSYEEEKNLLLHKDIENAPQIDIV